MRIQACCWFTIVLSVCQLSLAQTTVSLMSWQSSCDAFDKRTPPGQIVQKYGIQIDDATATSPLNLTPSATGNWGVTRNTSPGVHRVNVEWQGTYSDNGSAGHFDSFTVSSTGLQQRQPGQGMVKTCYEPLGFVTNDPVVLVNYGLVQGSDDDQVYIEGDQTLPVRAIRLEVYESAAGGDVIGGLIHSAEYEMPGLTEPFMSLRNLNHEPLHYSVSTGTHDFPLEIGNHDDYAALVGMVGDGAVRTLPAAGDFDHNGVYEVVDMDALANHIQEVAQGDVMNLSFDINGDGQVDPADAERWLANAGAALNPDGAPFLPSDGNLDGVVDGSDFLLWNAHKFTPLPGFSKGDWNYDGVVDGSDFLLWNAHKFSSSDGVAVPEPMSASGLLLGLAGLLVWRRRGR